MICPSGDYTYRLLYFGGQVHGFRSTPKSKYEAILDLKRKNYKPQPLTRAIDMMLWDEKGVYFLTAKGKAFYDQLTEQKFVALSAVKDGKAVSLRGQIENIGSEKLDEIFEKNTYMQKIYPAGTRDALVVFRLFEVSGEYFDISDPEHIFRDQIRIGDMEQTHVGGYFISDRCIGCASCLSACPQQCIDLASSPAVIDQNHCLHCGRCVGACPAGAIERR